MKHIAYYRVSTKAQGRSGLGLEAQRNAVMAHINTAPIAEYTEVESGKKDNRPQLEAALSMAKLTGATLVVAKLDRLSRNAAFLNTLMDSGLNVVFADMPNADRLIIGIMAQLAQWEREQISKRTKEALQASKARGTKLGGDRGNLSSESVSGRQRSILVRVARSKERRKQILPHIDAAKAAGHVTLKAIGDYLNSLHITTAQGGKWHPASVKRIMERG